MDRPCAQGPRKRTRLAHQGTAQLDRILVIVDAQPSVRFNRVIHGVRRYWRKVDGQCGIYGYPTIQYDQVVRPSIHLYPINADKIGIGRSISSPRSSSNSFRLVSQSIALMHSSLKRKYRSLYPVLRARRPHLLTLSNRTGWVFTMAGSAGTKLHRRSQRRKKTRRFLIGKSGNTSVAYDAMLSLPVVRVSPQ